MGYKTDGTPQCDMSANCEHQVSHLDDGGYIYCATHADRRRAWARVRKLRPAELKRIACGEALGRY